MDLSNYLMGAGGCLRDEMSSWLAGFAKFLGLGNALQYELWAIWLGLVLLTQSFPDSKFQIETNSFQATDLLLQCNTVTHSLDSLIQNYRLLLSRLSDFKVIKAKRMQNRCEDLLAKEGRTKRLPLIIYNDVPNLVSLIYIQEKSNPSPPPLD